MFCVWFVEIFPLMLGFLINNDFRSFHNLGYNKMSAENQVTRHNEIVEQT